MNTLKQIGILWMAMILGTVAGCDQTMGLKTETQPTPANSDKSELSADYVQDQTITGDDQTKGRGAVDAAMEWADKYGKAAQELLYSQKRINELEVDKKKLQTELAQLKSDLAAYQRELNDANAMLNDMKGDLKQWRESVLGFRKDFMAAQNAILVSQQKILELLGGETGQAGYRAVRPETPPPSPNEAKVPTGPVGETPAEPTASLAQQE